MKNQKNKVKKRFSVVEAKRKAALSHTESPGQLEISDADLDDLSERYKDVMAKADFKTKAKIAGLLVNRVQLHQEKAIV